ncbi:MAG TPA: hypothetical protein VKW08_21925 [Xanthobacteraceae bacterium]|jgi:hypothetical protein|nr:hypothetical protein [Xanthobacteraceae bacterium]
MVNAPLNARVRCRRIEDADAGRIIDLLARGFARRRPRPFWERVIACLATRTKPADTPRYGYLMEHDGKAVGAILQIFATLPAGGRDVTRCNVSSWFVEPAFRGYAPLMVAQALKQKDVTYLNISSVAHTRPIVETQGFLRLSNGMFVALPCLSRQADVRARIVAGDTAPQAPHEPYERDLLQDHAAYGCMSLWCETPERAYPFVFRERRVKGLLTCAQLIYCRDVAELVRFARPLGFHLARRGRPLLILDANGPVRGLFGKYFDQTMPKYFKGPAPPRLGDLAYTETALFGM